MVSESWSMVTMAGSIVAGRYDTGAVTESLHPDPHCSWLETSRVAPPPTRPQLLMLPTQSTNWEPNTQTYEPMGDHYHSNHHTC